MAKATSTAKHPASFRAAWLAKQEIDHALTKFVPGTYGTWEASGDPIRVERSEAIAWARVQVQDQTGGIGRP